MLSKELFFQKATLKRKEVTLEGVGVVCVRELSAKEVSDYLGQHSKETPEIDMLAWLVVAGVCDGDGKPVFDSTDKDQIVNLPLPVVKQLAEAVVDVSGLRTNEKKDSPTVSGSPTA